MGCCGGNDYVVRDRVIHDEQRTFSKPASVMVLVTEDSDEDMIGKSTGFNYGIHKRGDAFSIPNEDYENDKRFVRTTSETLRLFT